MLSNTAGNFLLSVGLRNRDAFSPEALLSPAVLCGVALLILWTLARMALLSWADLSFVLPVTSIGYVLSALLGKFALAEAVSGPRWVGTILIVAGTALVAPTAKQGEPR